MSDFTQQLRNGFPLAVPNLVPVGTVFPFAGRSVPDGFLLCAGQNVNVADYPWLAYEIGRAYGGTSLELSTTSGSANVNFGFTSPRFPPYINPLVGDMVSINNASDFGLTNPPGMTGLPVFIVSASNTGSATPGPYQVSLTPGGAPLVATATNASPDVFTNLSGNVFALPDLRGRVPVGRDNMNGSAANRLESLANDGELLGESGGAATHLLLSSESGLPAHVHSVGGGQNTVQRTNTGSNTAGVGGGSTGANAAANAAQAHNNLQPLLIVNYIIRAK